MKNWTKKSMTEKYKVLHGTLVSRGSRPQMQILENGVSKVLLNFMGKWECWLPTGPRTYTLVERSRTINWDLENHFLARLSSVDEEFPMHFWDQLQDQAYIILNILQPTRINPMLSEYTIIWGSFDLNETPMVPPGCKIIFHMIPGKHGLWKFHGLPGFTLDPLWMAITHTRFTSQRRGQSNQHTLLGFFHNQQKFSTCQQQTPSQRQSPV